MGEVADEIRNNLLDRPEASGLHDETDIRGVFRKFVESLTDDEILELLRHELHKRSAATSGSQVPVPGRMVHYVSAGSADGTYPKTCRAAIITEALPQMFDGAVALAVVNPEGLHFRRTVRHDEDDKASYTWHWPERV